MRTYHCKPNLIRNILIYQFVFVWRTKNTCQKIFLRKKRQVRKTRIAIELPTALISKFSSASFFFSLFDVTFSTSCGLQSKDGRAAIKMTIASTYKQYNKSLCYLGMIRRFGRDCQSKALQSINNTIDHYVIKVW